jgi:hypothetical protein
MAKVFAGKFALIESGHGLALELAKNLGFGRANSLNKFYSKAFNL